MRVMSNIVGNPFLVCVILFIIGITPISHLFAQSEQVEHAMFNPLQEKLNRARENQVPLYSPQNYNKALQLLQSAQADFEKGEKLSKIREQIGQADELLNQAFETTRVSKVAMEELVNTRSRFQEQGLMQSLPDEVSRSEQYFRDAMLEAEKGDLRKARTQTEWVYAQYRLTIVKWLKDVFIKQHEKEVKSQKGSLDRQMYDQTINGLKGIRDYVDETANTDFDPFQLRVDVTDQVRGVLEVIYPPFYKNLPDTLLIGAFKLIVEQYSDKGVWDFKKKEAVGLSGMAWTSFNCPAVTPTYTGSTVSVVEFDVVSVVTDPAAEISLKDAVLIQPDIQVGGTVDLQLAVEKENRYDILRAKNEILKQVNQLTPKGDILVHFNEATISEVSGRTNTGQIVKGTAAYPSVPVYPEIVILSLSGFTAYIDTFTLKPAKAFADIVLEFPSCIGDLSTCKSVSLDLGSVRITQQCGFYKKMKMKNYGPWTAGETGMVITGKDSVIVDFSPSKSPLSKKASWTGVLLRHGKASGKTFVSDSSNTGFLAGQYTYKNGAVTGTGLKGTFTLTKPITFFPVHPLGYKITAGQGYLDVKDCKIDTGALKTGSIELPTVSVCWKTAKTSVTASFSSLAVHSDLDLSGKVSFSSERSISWGELTHVKNELIPWDLVVTGGYFYLPGGPVQTFSPDLGSKFLDLRLKSTDSAVLAQMDSMNMAGIMIDSLNIPYDITIYSPDGHRGTSEAITMKEVDGWLRIGSMGVDGELKIKEYDIALKFGNVKRSGYVGGKAFVSTLNESIKEGYNMIQYVRSAVYDSEINGSLDIPPPCNISDLEFKDMEFTSTANMVGGGIALEDTVTLEYWDLKFLKTDPTVKEAGFISARTGRLVFTGAGIWEDVHFKKPFGLTWCEMYADGNIGELYLNYNHKDQRFDNLRFVPGNIALSKAKAGTKGPKEGAYLAVSGTVHFNFFGSNFINIKDEYSIKNTYVYKTRYVTVPKTGDASSKKTNLYLYGEWNPSDKYNKKNLATFEFLNEKMNYDTTKQEGFKGSGNSTIAFLSDNLGSTGTPSKLPSDILIRSTGINICFSTTSILDVDLGLILTLGSISEFYGCARITGPQLKLLSFGGNIETAASTSLIQAQTGYYVCTNTTLTPNSCTTYASGDMVFAVATTSVLVSGSMYLHVDHKKDQAYGDVNGTFDFNSTGIDMEGKGQITWYIDNKMQHYQGRVSLEMCSWSGSGSLEGGLFFGANTPKEKAWVLETTSEHFGISQAILPATLTGFYGYGQLSFSLNWYIISGGLDIYAGVGAFVDQPQKYDHEIEKNEVDLPFPYFLGSAGLNVHGEILGGIVSASAWGDLDLYLDPSFAASIANEKSPFYFEGNFGIKGCILFVLCASVDVTAGLSQDDGFYLY